MFSSQKAFVSFVWRDRDGPSVWTEFLLAAWMHLLKDALADWQLGKLRIAGSKEALPPTSLSEPSVWLTSKAFISHIASS